MDVTAMVKVASWLFLLAAAGGLLMAGLRFGTGRNPPIWIAYGHGLLAGAGLTLLIYAAVVHPRLPAQLAIAIGLLLFAAAGGSVLNLAYHWRGRPIPTGLTAGHILLALAGLVTLLLVVYRPG